MERQTERELKKNVAGDNEKWRKAPTHHLSYRSATAWQFTSWINSLMVIWSGRNGFGCCWWWWPHPIWRITTLSFHSNCTDRETSQQKHYVGATSSHAICPCSPRTYTVLKTSQRTRSTSRSRFFGRPLFTIGNKTNLASSVVNNTEWCNVLIHRLLQGFLDIIFIRVPSDN